MPISNPSRSFINGSETVDFTYEGGTTLYHFSPRDNGLSNSMEFNTMFLANSEEHALEVLGRLFDFLIKSNYEYLKYSYNKHTDEEVSEHITYRLRNVLGYQKALKEGKIKVSLVPTNQFFKVSWADNDGFM